MTSINGLTGPYQAPTAGAYGRNAAHNERAAEIGIGAALTGLSAGSANTVVDQLKAVLRLLNDKTGILSTFLSEDALAASPVINTLPNVRWTPTENFLVMNLKKGAYADILGYAAQHIEQIAGKDAKTFNRETYAASEKQKMSELTGNLFTQAKGLLGSLDKNDLVKIISLFKFKLGPLSMFASTLGPKILDFVQPHLGFVANAAGDKALKDPWFDAADRHKKDGKIDAVEYAAYSLFRDNPAGFIAGVKNDAAQKVLAGQSSKLDGEITAAEAQLTRNLLENTPNAVGDAIEKIIASHKPLKV